MSERSASLFCAYYNVDKHRYRRLDQHNGRIYANLYDCDCDYGDVTRGVRKWRETMGEPSDVFLIEFELSGLALDAGVEVRAVLNIFDREPICDVSGAVIANVDYAQKCPSPDGVAYSILQELQKLFISRSYVLSCVKDEGPASKILDISDISVMLTELRAQPADAKLLCLSDITDIESIDTEILIDANPEDFDCAERLMLDLGYQLPEWRGDADPLSSILSSKYIRTILCANLEVGGEWEDKGKGIVKMKELQDYMIFLYFLM